MSETPELPPKGAEARRKISEQARTRSAQRGGATMRAGTAEIPSPANVG